jgi:hypothetical protein
MPPTEKQTEKFYAIYNGLQKYSFHGLNFQKIIEKKIWASLGMTFKQKLLKTYFNLFRQTYVLEKTSGDGNYLFYIEDFLRADHWANYQKIMSVLSDYQLGQLILHRKNGKGSVSKQLHALFEFFATCLSVVFKIKRLDVLPAIAVLATEIMYLEDFYRQLLQYPMDERCVILFHDADPFQNMICQLLKSKKPKTITMQHGVFIDWEYRGRHSFDYENTTADYFFAWGQKTKDLILRKNPGINVKLVGHPFFIGMPEPEHAQTDVFGVVLGSLTFRNENRDLVRFAQAASELVGKKYIVKLHPADSESAYEDIGHANCLAFLSKETDLFGYLKRVEFSISNPSSLLFQLLFFNHLAVQYGPAFKQDPNSKDWISIDDETTFMEFYDQKEKLKTDGSIIRFIAQIFEPGDTALNYRNAFLSLLQEQA